ncbi:hypothetical protein KY084_00030 [Stakelama sp. CBK3Z-3]|uniref:Iron uptake protein n=1 Tax=Stakelama flava TaxID=2860338 RepID=A0ABS6XGA4_9SPHN|nr:hypothetical protein [Stakelama flava]MBW4329264.1 hypothetical protein [Stakelama flava]
MKTQLTARDWFGKASAGLVLGFVIALGVSGLVSLALGVGDAYFSTTGQFTMWLIAPVWSLILAFCFLFRSGLRAWVLLGIVALIAWAALYVLGGTAL